MDGISAPDFADDQIVEVIWAQAPLFSTVPQIGQKLAKFDMYHSAIVLAQGANLTRRYWTLEFDMTSGRIATSLAPTIIGDSIGASNSSFKWDVDARYCLTPGLKWSRKHWTEHFEIVTSVSSDQAMEAFTEFIPMANGTTPGSQPQYQPLQVSVSNFFGKPKTVVQDTTCTDGALWFLQYLSSRHNAAMPPNFKFKGTRAVIKAKQLQKVDLTDPQSKARTMKYFKLLGELISLSRSPLHDLINAVEFVAESKYLYDASDNAYYEVIGLEFPWVKFEYVEYALQAYPWQVAYGNSSIPTNVLSI
jgi:hypothetical protein